MEINIRENRRGNQEWAIQRHWEHKTQEKYKQTTKHLKDEQHKPHQKLGVNPAACEG